MQPNLIVTINVHPDRLAPFLALAERHAALSRLEAGCLRFDLLRDLHHPFRFFLFEVFADTAALGAHRRTEHYARWRNEVPLYEQTHARSEAEVIDGGALVFTNGCFDSLGVHHLSLLKEAKAQGGRLVVAVNSDESVRRLKGRGRPLVPLQERMALLSEMRCVDEVVSFDTDEELLGLMRLYNVEVLVKGGDYALDEVLGRELVESLGGRVYLARFVTGRSTTALIQKAVLAAAPPSS